MAPELFIEQSIEGLRVQTAAHAATWHLGEEDEWSADLDNRQISFLFADGTSATAELQIVGTYNTDDGTFLWGWDAYRGPAGSALVYFTFGEIRIAKS